MGKKLLWWLRRAAMRLVGLGDPSVTNPCHPRYTGAVYHDAAECADCRMMRKINAETVVSRG